MTYDEFIQNIINTRGQWNIPENEYYEAHHIIPLCLGGDGGRDHHSKHNNIIWLYPREHFIAHQLLIEKYPDNYKLKYALWCMATGFTNNKDLYQITPEEYEKLKFEYSQTRKEMCKNTNHWTEESANKFRASRAYKRENGIPTYVLKAGRPTGINSSNHKAIKCIETGEIFVSCKEAAQKGYSTAGKAAKLGTTSGGYHFKYITDEEVLANE